MPDRTAIRSDSLRTWCEEAGGDFYRHDRGRTTGYYGCDVDGDRVEVERRSGRPNTINLKSEEMGFHRLGLSKDADLVRGDGSRRWVETTEATLGTDDRTTGLVEGGVRASKMETREKRERQKSMWGKRS